MTHKERAVTALTLGQPDYVPTFELEYQLADLKFGKDFLMREALAKLSGAERERAVLENAEYMVKVYGQLGYSIIPVHYLEPDDLITTARHINKITNGAYLLAAHGDGTYAIPDRRGDARVCIRSLRLPRRGKGEGRARWRMRR